MGELVAMIPRDAGPPGLLLTISGGCRHPGLYELSRTTTIAEALEYAGAELADVRGLSAQAVNHARRIGIAAPPR